MAGGEHEPWVSDGSRNPNVVGLHDSGLLDAVDEAAVRHFEDHLIARMELVELAERCEVGGAVAGSGQAGVTATSTSSSTPLVISTAATKRAICTRLVRMRASLGWTNGR